jgi:hypothetical protein
MESNLVTKPIPDLTTNSELSFEICKEALDAGYALRYDSISYRGEEINFLSDVSGVKCVAQWRGQLVDLGMCNIYYKEDMCRYVDHVLDLITDFRNYPDFAGAKLEYFHNGDFRDIRLCYKDRILKVFLVAGEVNETLLISESEKILKYSGLLEEPAV